MEQACCNHLNLRPHYNGHTAQGVAPLSSAALACNQTRWPRSFRDHLLDALVVRCLRGRFGAASLSVRLQQPPCVQSPGASTPHIHEVTHPRPRTLECNALCGVELPPPDEERSGAPPKVGNG